MLHNEGFLLFFFFILRTWGPKNLLNTRGPQEEHSPTPVCSATDTIIHFSHPDRVEEEHVLMFFFLSWHRDIFEKHPHYSRSTLKFKRERGQILTKINITHYSRSTLKFKGERGQILTKINITHDSRSILKFRGERGQS